jgi:hypothetical protein
MRYVLSGVSRFTVTVTTMPRINVASPLLQPMREAVDGFGFETFSGVFIPIIFQRDHLRPLKDNSFLVPARDGYEGLRLCNVSFVGCDKFALANAGTPDSASIIPCSPAARQSRVPRGDLLCKAPVVCLHSLLLVCHTLRYSPHSGSSQPGTGSMPPQSRSYSPSLTKR